VVRFLLGTKPVRLIEGKLESQMPQVVGEKGQVLGALTIRCHMALLGLPNAPANPPDLCRSGSAGC